MIINKTRWLVFALIFLSVLLLFYSSLNYYFFQDDWFVLNWVREGNWRSFFDFRTDIIYWRPLSMPLFFKLGTFLFGLNPKGFHLVVFLFHFINIILVYMLAATLKITRLSSVIISFIYATASFHFVPLSWLSTTSYIVGPTFIIATLILFLKQRIFLSLIFFILALAASELGLMVIPIVVLLPKNFKLILKPLLVFLAIALIYLILRFLIFPMPATGQYQLEFSNKVLINFIWYFLWFFNVPEKMSTIIFFTMPESFVNAFAFLKYLAIPLIIILAFLLFGIFSNKKRELLRGIVIFLVGILPVIFLTNHAYAMYLVISSLGMLYIFGVIFDELKLKLAVYIFALLWFISSLLTISFNRTNYWLVNQQSISKAYVNYVKSFVENPPANSIFIIKPANIGFSRQNNFTLVAGEENVKQSLNNHDALQVIYNNSTLKSMYVTHEQTIDIPKDLNIIEVVPTK